MNIYKRYFRVENGISQNYLNPDFLSPPSMGEPEECNKIRSDFFEITKKFLEE